MEILDRLKSYQAFGEIGRKWSQVMDAKASFLATLNVALIGFIWTGAKLGEIKGYASYFGMLGTAIALWSLYISLKAVFPRTTLKQTYGDEVEYSSQYCAVSYFGAVATNYPLSKHDKYFELVSSMNEEDFVREALEQHFTISHIVNLKSNAIALAARLWFGSVIVVVIAILLRGLCGV